MLVIIVSSLSAYIVLTLKAFRYLTK